MFDNIQKEQIYRKFIKVKKLMNYMTAINLSCRYSTRGSISKEINKFCNGCCNDCCKNSVIINKEHLCIIVMSTVRRVSAHYSVNDFITVKRYLEVI